MAGGTERNLGKISVSLISDVTVFIRELERAKDLLVELGQEEQKLFRAQPPPTLGGGGGGGGGGGFPNIPISTPTNRPKDLQGLRFDSAGRVIDESGKLVKGQAKLIAALTAREKEELDALAAAELYGGAMRNAAAPIAQTGIGAANLTKAIGEVTGLMKQFGTMVQTAMDVFRRSGPMTPLADTDLQATRDKLLRDEIERDKKGAMVKEASRSFTRAQEKRLEKLTVDEITAKQHAVDAEKIKERARIRQAQSFERPFDPAIVHNIARVGRRDEDQIGVRVQEIFDRFTTIKDTTTGKVLERLKPVELPRILQNLAAALDIKLPRNIDKQLETNPALTEQARNLTTAINNRINAARELAAADEELSKAEKDLATIVRNREAILAKGTTRTTTLEPTANQRQAQEEIFKKSGLDTRLGTSLNILPDEIVDRIRKQFFSLAGQVGNDPATQQKLLQNMIDQAIVKIPHAGTVTNDQRRALFDAFKEEDERPLQIAKAARHFYDTILTAVRNWQADADQLERLRNDRGGMLGRGFGSSVTDLVKDTGSALAVARQRAGQSTKGIPGTPGGPTDFPSSEEITQMRRETAALNREFGGLLGMRKTGDLITRTFGNMGVGIGNATAALLRFRTAMFGFNAISTITSGFTEFDDALARAGAVANASETELKAMSDAAREIGRTTPTSAAEAVHGLELLAQAGLDASQSVGTLNSVVKLAVGTGSSLEQSVNLVTSTLSAFHLSVSESNDIANVFAATVNKSKATIEGLNTTFNLAGPAAAAAGLSFKDLAAITGVLSNQGVKASTVGSSIRNILNNLIAPSEKAQKIFSALGLSLSDINPIGDDIVKVFQRLRAAGFGVNEAFQAFGIRGATAIAQVVREAEGIEIMRSQIEKTTAAFDAFDKATQSTAARAKIFRNNFQDLAIEFGNEFSSAIFKPLLDGGTAVIGLFRLMGDALKGLVAGATGFVGLRVILAAVNSTALETVSVFNPVVGVLALFTAALFHNQSVAEKSTKVIGEFTDTLKDQQPLIDGLTGRLIANAEAINTYNEKLGDAKESSIDFIAAQKEILAITNELIFRFPQFAKEFEELQKRASKGLDIKGEALNLAIEAPVQKQLEIIEARIRDTQPGILERAKNFAGTVLFQGARGLFNLGLDKSSLSAEQLGLREAAEAVRKFEEETQKARPEVNKFEEALKGLEAEKSKESLDAFRESADTLIKTLATAGVASIGEFLKVDPKNLEGLRLTMEDLGRGGILTLEGLKQRFTELNGLPPNLAAALEALISILNKVGNAGREAGKDIGEGFAGAVAAVNELFKPMDDLITRLQTEQQESAEDLRIFNEEFARTGNIKLADNAVAENQKLRPAIQERNKILAEGAKQFKEFFKTDITEIESITDPDLHAQAVKFYQKLGEDAGVKFGAAFSAAKGTGQNTRALADRRTALQEAQKEGREQAHIDAFTVEEQRRAFSDQMKGISRQAKAELSTLEAQRARIESGRTDGLGHSQAVALNEELQARREITRETDLLAKVQERIAFEQKIANNEVAGASKEAVIDAKRKVDELNDEKDALDELLDRDKLRLEFARKELEVQVNLGGQFESAFTKGFDALRTGKGKGSDILKGLGDGIAQEFEQGFAKALVKKLGFDKDFIINMQDLGDHASQNIEGGITGGLQGGLGVIGTFVKTALGLFGDLGGGISSAIGSGLTALGATDLGASFTDFGSSISSGGSGSFFSSSAPISSRPFGVTGGQIGPPVPNGFNTAGQVGQGISFGGALLSRGANFLGFGNAGSGIGNASGGIGSILGLLGLIGGATGGSALGKAGAGLSLGGGALSSIAQLFQSPGLNVLGGLGGAGGTILSVAGLFGQKGGIDPLQGISAGIKALQLVSNIGSVVAQNGIGGLFSMNGLTSALGLSAVSGGLAGAELGSPLLNAAFGGLGGLGGGGGALLNTGATGLDAILGTGAVGEGTVLAPAAGSGAASLSPLLSTISGVLSVVAALASVGLGAKGIADNRNSFKKATLGTANAQNNISTGIQGGILAAGTVAGGIAGGAAIGGALAVPTFGISIPVGIAIGAAIGAAVSQAVNAAITGSTTTAIGKTLQKGGTQKQLESEIHKGLSKNVILDILGGGGGGLIGGTGGDVFSGILNPVGLALNVIVSKFTAPNIEKIFAKLFGGALNKSSPGSNFDHFLTQPNEGLGPEGRKRRADFLAGGGGSDVRDFVKLAGTLLGAGREPGSRFERLFNITLNSLARNNDLTTDMIKELHAVIRGLSGGSFIRALKAATNLFGGAKRGQLNAGAIRQVNLASDAFADVFPNQGADLNEIGRTLLDGTFLRPGKSNKKARKASRQQVGEAAGELLGASTFEEGFTGFLQKLRSGVTEALAKGLAEGFIAKGPVGLALTEFFGSIGKLLRKAVKNPKLGENFDEKLERRVDKAGDRLGQLFADDGFKKILQNVYLINKKAVEKLDEIIAQVDPEADKRNRQGLIDQILAKIDGAINAVQSLIKGRDEALAGLDIKLADTGQDNPDIPDSAIQLFTDSVKDQRLLFDQNKAALTPQGKIGFLQTIEGSIDTLLSTRITDITNHFSPLIDAAQKARDAFLSVHANLLQLQTSKTAGRGPNESLGKIATEIAEQRKILKAGSPEEQLKAAQRIQELAQLQLQVGQEQLDPNSPTFRALERSSEAALSEVEQTLRDQGASLEDLTQEMKDEIKDAHKDANAQYLWVRSELKPAFDTALLNANTTLGEVYQILFEKLGLQGDITAAINLLNTQSTTKLQEIIDGLELAGPGNDLPNADPSGQPGAEVLPDKPAAGFRDRAKHALGGKKGTTDESTVRFAVGAAVDALKPPDGGEVTWITSDLFQSLQDVFKELAPFDFGEVALIGSFVKQELNNLAAQEGSGGTHPFKWIQGQISKSIKAFFNAIHPAAMGMIATGPTLGLFGERDVEAAIPLNQRGMSFMIQALTRAMEADRSLGAAAVGAAGARSDAVGGQFNVVIQPGAFQTTIEKDDPNIMAAVERLPKQFLEVVRRDIQSGVSKAIIKEQILRR